MSDYVKPLSDHLIEHGAISRLEINHPAATAEVFLQGAHLARWKPAGEAAGLYMSPHSKFEHGQPIRGGVPVCFPWFGANAENPNLPSHGFARTQVWDLIRHESDADGIRLHLQLRSSELTRKLWPHDFVADIKLTIGRTLAMTFSVTNTGPTEFSFESALHTYYSVSDARHVSVSGLTGGEYLDKPDGFKRKTETADAIRFEGETDRVYLNTTATCVIDDPGEQRRIVIEKQGSQSTVVWNPAAKRAGQLKDLGEANWTPFVCVETANVGDNKVHLQPGHTHTTAMLVRIERA